MKANPIHHRVIQRRESAGQALPLRWLAQITGGVENESSLVSPFPPPPPPSYPG